MNAVRFSSEIKRKQVMAKLRIVALCNPLEKNQDVVNNLLRSIPEVVHGLLPTPEKLRAMVKNIRYCNPEFQAQLALNPPLQGEDHDDGRRRRRPSNDDDDDHFGGGGGEDGGGISPKHDPDEDWDDEMEEKIKEKKPRKKRETKSKRENLLGLGMLY